MAALLTMASSGPDRSRISAISVATSTPTIRVALFDQIDLSAGTVHQGQPAGRPDNGEDQTWQARPGPEIPATAGWPGPPHRPHDSFRQVPVGNPRGLGWS